MWEPFGTISGNGTTGWRSSPNERGTLNILSSCFITLLLCAYTSLHLDIPRHGKGGWTHQLWRRTIWVCLGFGAPEVVAFIAFRQMLFARNLEARMQELTMKHLREPPKVTARPSFWSRSFFTKSKPQPPLECLDLENITPESVQTRDGTCDDNGRSHAALVRSHVWTRVHSHFALMGGFVFDCGRRQKAAIGLDGERLTLTPVALRKIAEQTPDILPDISETTIKDKGKASSFAKFLVCVQASWFIAQVVGRLATGLPISLLEMNTLLHAFCCLLIYMAWWHKPLDIEEPHIISAHEDYGAKICAWMLTKDSLHGYVRAHQDDSDGYSHATSANALRIAYEIDLSILVYENSLSLDFSDRVDKEKSLRNQTLNSVAKSKQWNKQDGRPDVLTLDDFMSQRTLSRTATEDPFFKLYPGQKIHGFVLYAVDESKSGFYAKLSTACIERLRLAQSLRQEQINFGNAWWFYDQWLFHNPEGSFLTRGTTMASMDSPDRELNGSKTRSSSAPSPNQVYWTGLLLSASCYGGLHLLAWNAPFPSTTRTAALAHLPSHCESARAGSASIGYRVGQSGSFMLRVRHGENLQSGAAPASRGLQTDRTAPQLFESRLEAPARLSWKGNAFPVRRRSHISRGGMLHQPRASARRRLPGAGVESLHPAFWSWVAAGV